MIQTCQLGVILLPIAKYSVPDDIRLGPLRHNLEWGHWRRLRILFCKRKSAVRRSLRIRRSDRIARLHKQLHVKIKDKLVATRINNEHCKQCDVLNWNREIPYEECLCNKIINKNPFKKNALSINKKKTLLIFRKNQENLSHLSGEHPTRWSSGRPAKPASHLHRAWSFSTVQWAFGPHCLVSQGPTKHIKNRHFLSVPCTGPSELKARPWVTWKHWKKEKIMRPMKQGSSVRATLWNSELRYCKYCCFVCDEYINPLNTLSTV